MDVIAGLHGEAVSLGREKRSTVCCLSPSINIGVGLHDEAVSSGREKRSTAVCCLS
jgi:hypothetical protein